MKRWVGFTIFALIVIVYATSVVKYLQKEEISPPQVASSKNRVVSLFDIPYRPFKDTNPSYKLDIYYISNQKPKKPAIFIHGGSWVKGDKSNIREAKNFINWLLQKDYVLIVPNFRLATKENTPAKITYKEQLKDIAQALSWVKQNGHKYSIKSEGSLLIGYSSGAHLVALLATDHSYLESARLSPYDIAGFISLDIHTYNVPFAIQLMSEGRLDPRIPFIKHLFGDTKEEQLKASPEYHIPKDKYIPKSFIVSLEAYNKPGTRGYTTYRASKRFSEALNKAGHYSVWRHYINKKHATVMFSIGAPNDNLTKDLEQFLKRIENNMLHKE